MLVREYYFQARILGSASGATTPDPQRLRAPPNQYLVIKSS